MIIFLVENIIYLFLVNVYSLYIKMRYLSTS
jgi:hypothetical protein